MDHNIMNEKPSCARSINSLRAQARTNVPAPLGAQYSSWIHTLENQELITYYFYITNALWVQHAESVWSTLFFLETALLKSSLDNFRMNKQKVNWTGDSLDLFHGGKQKWGFMQPSLEDCFKFPQDWQCLWILN